MGWPEYWNFLELGRIPRSHRMELSLDAVIMDCERSPRRLKQYPLFTQVLSNFTSLSLRTRLLLGGLSSVVRYQESLASFLHRLSKPKCASYEASTRCIACDIYSAYMQARALLLCSLNKYEGF